MRNSTAFDRTTVKFNRLVGHGANIPRQLIIGIILILALFAFEMFNFDTTRYALQSLLGDIRFAGIAWATILAVAFCAIDFAGLARLFTPERGQNEPKEVWYLTGAWLLGASMNAVMTWWAVSLVLLDHDLGNEVLSREQLLQIVPVFVAILVWLTRILFIGAVTIAGERLLHGQQGGGPGANKTTPQRNSSQQNRGAQKSATATNQATYREPVELGAVPQQTVSGTTRVRQRPPRPAANGANPVPYRGISASSRRPQQP